MQRRNSLSLIVLASCLAAGCQSDEPKGVMPSGEPQQVASQEEAKALAVKDPGRPIGISCLIERSEPHVLSYHRGSTDSQYGMSFEVQYIRVKLADGELRLLYPAPVMIDTGTAKLRYSPASGMRVQEFLQKYVNGSAEVHLDTDMGIDGIIEPGSIAYLDTLPAEKGATTQSPGTGEGHEAQK
jgi:hypothetical protein